MRACFIARRVLSIQPGLLLIAGADMFAQPLTGR